MSGATVIRGARGILTGLPGAAERAQGDILVQDGRIAAIGSFAAPAGARVLDAGNCVITPGLISAHHHLFQSMLKGIPVAIDAGLETWLRQVPFTYWPRIDEEALRVAAEVGMAELLLSGCTTVADHHYLFAEHYDYAPEAVLFETAERFGVRLALLRGGTTRGRHFDTPDIVPTPNETLDVMLSRVQAMVARYHDPAPDARRRVVLAPNTPTWGVAPGELRMLAQAARQMGIRLHSHLSETMTYVTFCQSTYGCRPVQWLAQHDWLGPDVWYAHLVHVDEGELSLLAQTGTGMAHCPQSNARLGSGIAPADALDRMGGRVGLAADGAASNEACDMISEMHCAWLTHRSTKGPAAVRCEDILRWATAGAAEVLGWPAIGTIAVGQAADIAVFDLAHPRYAGLHDPLVAPVASGGGAHVRHALVGGRSVVEDGVIPGLDLPALTARASAVVKRLAA
jgi:cytosine/adenosine deaminase-related metal-dependent hydrolase